MDFTDQRLSYEKGSLTKADLLDDPIELLEKWLEVAIDKKVQEPYAMSLATCGEDNVPAVRIVLMRELNENGVVFYTNYNSAKGLDLMANPHAEVLFFWHELERQVRIGGRVEKIKDDKSDNYFHKRPRDSQIAAWVSDPQSGVVANRESIDKKFADLKHQYSVGTKVPRPEFWGGYQLFASKIEFWQGRTNRIHDRLIYSKEISNNGGSTSWNINRLLP